MGALDKAKRQARKAIESMYDGVCTIEEYRKNKDPVTKIMSLDPVIVLDKQPCRVSYSNISTASQSESTANIIQSVKLFIAPEINILAGSKITVTQNGRATVYKNSGEPAIYSTHQEIFLEVFEDKA